MVNYCNDRLRLCDKHMRLNEAEEELHVSGESGYKLIYTLDRVVKTVKTVLCVLCSTSDNVAVRVRI
jgi:hypothetical protein